MTGGTRPDASRAAARVRRARVQLLLGHPFFGSLALHLAPTPVRADWCASFATDGRRFFYSERFVEGVSDAVLVYCVAHAVLHLALDHAGRRGGRDVRRWDAATDHAVNAILLAPVRKGGEGMTAPKGTGWRKDFAGLAAEEIYRRLPPGARVRRPGPDVHLDAAPAERGAAGSSTVEGELGSEPGRAARAGADESSGEGVPGAEASGEADVGDEPAPWTGPPPRTAPDRALWRRHALGAAVAARLRGELPASMERALGERLRPRLRWSEILARYIHAFFREDYRLPPANRRFIHQGIYLPRVTGERLSLVVAIDTSGSIDDRLLAQFAGELQGILLSVPSYSIELLACDAAIGTHVTIESPEPFGLERLTGGGGTDFRPVFERVAREGWLPDALVYLTDGEGRFPDAAPDYPVLWVIHGSDERPPFGSRIVLDADG